MLNSPANESDKAPEREWVPVVLAGFAAVPTILGVIKTLAEASTGQPFSLSDAAYYVGWAAFGAYAGAFFALLLGGVMTEWLGVSDENTIRAVQAVVFIFWVVMLVYAAGAPQSNDGGFFRVVGVLTVVGAGIGFGAWKAGRT